MAVASDSDRAAAIGNTTALREVLQRNVAAVARERIQTDPEAVGDVPEDKYSLVLATLLIELIENERKNATQRGFKLADENAAALAQAVQQIRST